MAKNLLKIEKYLFFGTIGLLAISVVTLIISGIKEQFVSLRYTFSNIFNGIFATPFRAVFLFVALVAVLIFVVFWILSQMSLKRYSFGPLYLALFLILFIFNNSYFDAIPTNDISYIFGIITTIYCFLATIYCFVAFFIATKEVEGE